MSKAFVRSIAHMFTVLPVHVRCFGVIINDDNKYGDFWMIFDVPAAEVKQNVCELLCIRRNVHKRIKQKNTIRYDTIIKYLTCNQKTDG